MAGTITRGNPITLNTSNANLTSTYAGANEAPALNLTTYVGVSVHVVYTKGTSNAVNFRPRWAVRPGPGKGETNAHGMRYTSAANSTAIKSAKWAVDPTWSSKKLTATASNVYYFSRLGGNLFQLQAQTSGAAGTGKFSAVAIPIFTQL